MKKILLLCQLLFGAFLMAQVSYTQDWTATGLNNWTSVSSGGSFSRITTASQLCGSSGGTIRSEQYYGTTGQFTSPAITGNNQGVVTMSFDYKITNYSAGTTATPLTTMGVIAVQYATNSGGPWVTAYTIDSSNHIVTNTCATKTVTFSPGGGDLYVRFNVTSSSSADVYYYFDNVVISQGVAPTCLVPASLSTTGFTSNSISLSWSAPTPAPANGYDIYYSTTNTAPTSSTTPSITGVTSTSTTIPGLLANTTYYIWVRSNCSSSDKSVWTNAISAYTGYCVPTAGSSSTSYYLKTISTTNATTNLGYSATAYSAYVDNTSTTFSGYPGNVVNFSLANSTTATCYFYIYVDWNNDLDFADSGETLLATTTYAASTTGSFTIPSGQALGNYRARFALSESGVITSCGPAPYGNYVDFTLNVVSPPTCIVPTSLSTTGFTSNSISLSWSAPTPAPANGYDIYYSTTNTAPTSSTTPSITGVTSTSTTIPGLLANTTYYIWVRSNCSSSDKSVWTNAISAYTGYCVPTAGSSSTSYYLKTISTTNATTNLGYSATAYSAYVDNTSTTFSGYPGNVVNFSLANSTTATCYFYIYVDWNNDLDFADSGETLLATTTYAASTTGSFTIPSGQALGNYRARFALSESGVITSCGPAPYGNYVDFTLNVVSPPTCIAPTALQSSNITTNSAGITWTASTTVPANGYDVYYSTSSATPASTVTPQYTNVMSTSQTISGLSPATQYYVWVRSSCSSTDISAWSNSVTLTSACVAVATFTENFDSSSVGSLPQCWSSIGTTVSYAAVTASTAMSGPNALYIYTSGTTTGVVATPELSNLQSGNYTLKFNGRANYTAGGIVEIGYLTNFSDISTFVALGSYTATSISSVDNYSLDIIGVPAGVSRLVLRHTGNPSYSVLIDNISYELNASLATNEIKMSNAQLKIYPNPFTDLLTISDVKNVKSITISDMSGKIVKTFNKPESTLRLGDLNAGMYLVILNMNDGSRQTIKAIKK